ncbi:hypothetical protein Asera_28190 [Actinocatenispora sera]|uniref:Uncharacterized protein n=1 Tax=Actinocatenispora sera TaxID=390989 RepID=A0A810L2S9_9ACTN|nr:hypothetical protein Asera_28190 [Actinocatenispora sera]
MTCGNEVVVEDQLTAKDEWPFVLPSSTPTSSNAPIGGPPPSPDTRDGASAVRDQCDQQLNHYGQPATAEKSGSPRFW